ncbi:MAG: S49 family peptidase [Rhodospirillales bacterium]|jgi:signal peptide peptidase SppA|nr:S49 family peptidase [Rhodospirillales bacterium]
MIRSLLEKYRVPGFRNPRPLVAVVRLTGVIGTGTHPLRPGLNLATLNRPLEQAFSMKGVKAVALSVNSPGGAPAQSSLIFKRIRSLAEEHDLPVITFAEDVAASGGYWLACAGDEIIADDTSIIGSLGVVSAGFGFPQLLRRLGIERRVHTAGERKSMLDPFLREDPEDVARLKLLQGDVHDAFKAQVRERRAGKLKGEDDALFSGEFWTGRRALELGLIDGIGELTSEMRARYGDKVRFRPVGERRGWLRRRLNLGMGQGAWSGGGGGAWAADLLAVVEEKALWGRFGL